MCALLVVAVLEGCGNKGASERIDAESYCQAVRAESERVLDVASLAQAREAHRLMAEGGIGADRLVAAQRVLRGLMVDYRVTRAFAGIDGICVNEVCPAVLDLGLVVGKGDITSSLDQAQTLLAALRGGGVCASRAVARKQSFCDPALRDLLHVRAVAASTIAQLAHDRDAMPQDNPVGSYGVTEMVVELEREARLAVAYSAAVVDACVPPALRPACHQLLAAPGDDGPALAAKLSAIDHAIKGDPCGGGS